MTDSPSPLSGYSNEVTEWRAADLPRVLRPHRSRPITTMVTVTLIILLGSLLGISTAYLIIEREQPLNAVVLGPWQAYPKAGTPEADPYSAAIYTRGAVIPLASGEGLSLVAREDDDGNTLDPTCTYLLSGQTPAARLWTLTAVDAGGRLSATLPGRTNLVSNSLLRNEDGSFEIFAAERPRSGNWLPLPAGATPTDGMRLVLRLYDAPVTTGSALQGVNMPGIKKLDCQ